MTRVLGIVGSPRRGGNTDVLVTEALRGAAAAGAQTERVFLADLEIGPCLACRSCVDGSECCQQDDMGALLAKMFDSDAWILGTPVYWWGPSAQMKTFIDRWYATIHTPALRVRMAKRLALITPFADADPGTARHVVGMLEDCARYLAADFRERLQVTAKDRGEVAANTKAMADAFNLGKRLATA